MKREIFSIRNLNLFYLILGIVFLTGILTCSFIYDYKYENSHININEKISETGLCVMIQNNKMSEFVDVWEDNEQLYFFYHRTRMLAIVFYTLTVILNLMAFYMKMAFQSRR